jgi:hypothetical protein
LEKEMWDQFYNTGFWRSPSQIGTWWMMHHWCMV